MSIEKEAEDEFIEKMRKEASTGNLEYIIEIALRLGFSAGWTMSRSEVSSAVGRNGKLNEDE